MQIRPQQETPSQSSLAANQVELLASLMDVEKGRGKGRGCMGWFLVCTETMVALRQCRQHTAQLMQAAALMPSHHGP